MVIYVDPRSGAEEVHPLKNAVRRLLMPYGIWGCEDGREVLFSRKYKPIWERLPGAGTWTPANGHERVRFVRQAWFYNDVDSSAGRAEGKARAEMEKRGVLIPDGSMLVRKARETSSRC